MAPTVPNGEPSVLIAGDSWQWDKRLTATPPSEGWALTYEFRGPAAVTAITAAPSGAGDYYEVREVAADTAAVTAGTYELAGFVTLGPDRFRVYRGTVTIQADLEGATALESHAEKALRIITATLEGRFTEDTTFFQINGRAVNQIPILELRRLQGSYRLEVWRERNPGRLAPSLAVNFAPPS